MKLADKLSIVRVIFAPIFAIFYLLIVSKNTILPWFREHSLGALFILSIILAFVEITDFFDGYYARKLKETSDLGKLLDPFADAFLHITAFFCFAYTKFMPPFAFLIIFYREFSMMFLRMQTVRRGIVIAARPGGKFKTVIYIFSCFLTLAVQLYDRTGWTFIPFSVHFKLICSLFFYLCALFALVSFLDYIYHFVIVLNKKERSK